MKNKDNTPKKKFELKDIIFAFLFPVLVGKMLFIYFAQDEVLVSDSGVNWGMIGALTLTIGLVARFLWKYRNYED